MNRNEPVIHSDPDIMGGTPVFVGTRVPLATLPRILETLPTAKRRAVTRITAD